MSKRSLFVIGVLIALVFGVVGWWLLSPLFIDTKVDEAFPFELPSEAELAAMSETEMKELAAEFEAAMPASKTIAELSPEDEEKLEKMVIESAVAVMPNEMMEEPMPAAPTEWLVVVQGQFMDADAFHQGAGSATVYQQGEKIVLRLENFSVTNGPDLHVILSKHPAPTSRSDVGEDYIDLGQLKGNQGDQNYNIPHLLCPISRHFRDCQFELVLPVLLSTKPHSSPSLLAND
jgi:hypothetical protein